MPRRAEAFRGHSHPWDESFYVVRGEIEFGIDADTKTALPGTG
jgi:quercetin dioxygenase-like cupin family protein